MILAFNVHRGFYSKVISLFKNKKKLPLEAKNPYIKLNDLPQSVNTQLCVLFLQIS